ncbi:hypothetical protein M5K25_011703 [Dendrobium thyrsiflorum]|uniref:Core Histone H2A/H2B/H3 domain-containing protein n=1 Tax=Dendrobium thyrsiflorum TaxID=117978 RepID=A0ABD0V3F7_DENTH
MGPKPEKKPTAEKPAKEKEKKAKVVEKRLPASKEGDGVGEKRKKREDKRGSETYKIYIFKVLEHVHPDIAISSKAMSIMNSFINDIFEKLANEASRLARYNKEIQTFILCFPVNLRNMRFLRVLRLLLSLLVLRFCSSFKLYDVL